MNDLKFYLAMLRLMLDERNDSKPAIKGRRPSGRRRFQRFLDKQRLSSHHNPHPQRALRGGQTMRSKTRHTLPGKKG